MLIVLEGSVPDTGDCLAPDEMSLDVIEHMVLSAALHADSR